MKTKLPIGLLALSLAILTGFSACQKDALTPIAKELRVIDARTWDQRTFEDNGNDPTSADEAGSLQIIVRPEDADAKIRIYSDDFDSGEFPAIPDGVNFRIVPPGFYTMDITPNNPAYGPVQFVNIEVRLETLTDLGEIIL